MSKTMTPDEAEALRIAALEYLEASLVMKAMLVTVLAVYGQPPDDVKMKIGHWLHAGKELRIRLLGLEEAPSFPNLPPIFNQVGHA